MERRGFGLRDLLYLSEKFRGRSLVEAALPFQAEITDSLKDPQRADGVRFGGVFGFLERNGNMTLRRQVQVVDFIGLDPLYGALEAGTVGHVPVVQGQFRVLDMGVGVEVVYPVRVDQ